MSYMAVTFPTNPVDGQTFMIGQQVYRFSVDRSRWVATGYTYAPAGPRQVGAISGLPSSSAGYLQLPQGSNSQRGTASTGSTRVNSQLNQIEVFNGTAWTKMLGTGYAVDLLLVGGGAPGAGGAAGGYLAVNIPLTRGLAYTVGVGGAGSATTFTNSSTSVVVYTAAGGAPSGSGATYSPAQTLGFGYSNSPLGGGAGSREPGHATQGGSGTAWFDGSVYAAGGSTTGSAGAANTGNGGSGSNPGGSGVVKIRYPGTTQLGSGGTTATSGGYFYHTFTSAGGYFA
jgi:hypothetical protein